MPRETLIKVRQGTTAEWATADAASGADPDRLLAAGEQGRDTDTGVIKFGNGVDTWAELPVALAGTYVEAAELNAEEAARIAADALKADDDAVVKLTGDQTKAGTLEFANDVRFGSGRPWFDVRAAPFRATADGTSHPLSERFGSLAAAQAVYPRATALTQSIDWAAIQLALDTVANGAGAIKKVYAPGHYVLSDHLHVTKQGTEFFGDGPADSQAPWSLGGTVLKVRDANFGCPGKSRSVFLVGGDAANTTVNRARLSFLHDFSIDGGNLGTNTGDTGIPVAASISGITTIDAAKSKFERIFIYNCTGRGVNIDPEHLSTNPTSINTNHTMRFYGVEVQDCKGDGIGWELSGGVSNLVHFYDCDIRACRGYGFRLKGQGQLIWGGNLTVNYHEGILFGSVGDPGFTTGCLVFGAWLEGNGRKGTGSAPNGGGMRSDRGTGNTYFGYPWASDYFNRTDSVTGLGVMEIYNASGTLQFRSASTDDRRLVIESGDRFAITGGSVADIDLRFIAKGTGAVNFQSPVTIRGAASGSATKIYRHVANMGSVNFPSIAAGATAEMTMTVTGAKVGDLADVAPAGGAIESGLMWSGYVGAADQVTIRLHNTTAGAIDPAVTNWRCSVWSYQA